MQETLPAAAKVRTPQPDATMGTPLDKLNPAMLRALQESANKPRQGPQRARGRTQQPQGMNKSESAYAAGLEAKMRLGEVAWWMFEPMSLRLAANTFYRPDFLVMLADGTMEFHEVKGHWEDDARVKIKVAAETFWPFVFRAIRYHKGQFKQETFNQ